MQILPRVFDAPADGGFPLVFCKGGKAQEN